MPPELFPSTASDAADIDGPLDIQHEQRPVLPCGLEPTPNRRSLREDSHESKRFIDITAVVP
jgi:hypothetical protein